MNVGLVILAALFAQLWPNPGPGRAGGAPAGPLPALVQHPPAGSILYGTTVSVSFAGSTTTGSDRYVIAELITGDAGGSPAYTVKDCTGTSACAASTVNTWTQCGSGHAFSASAQNIFYAPVSGASRTVTASWTGNRYVALSIQEASGLAVSAVCDKTSGNDGAYGSSYTSGTTTTTATANELLIGACGSLYIGGNAQTVTPSTSPVNWSVLDKVWLTASPSTAFTQYAVVSSTGTYEASGTVGTADQAGCYIATFKGQ